MLYHGSDMANIQRVNPIKAKHYFSKGAEVSMLCGNVVAISTGGIVTIVVSLITNRDWDSAMEKEIWENTRDIDNPLQPWTERYAR